MGLLTCGPALLIVAHVAAAAPASPDGENVSLVVASNHTLSSKVLGETRQVLVTLPERYDEGDQRYPLLLALDGSPTTAAYAEMSAVDRGFPAFIIVSLPNVDRVRDLEHRSVPGIWPTGGGATRFLTFLADELVPWVEARYRTTGYRVITGGSAAGRFALFALLSVPEVFDAAIARSPMLGTDELLMTSLARRVFAGPSRGEHDLAIVYGSHDLPGVTISTERFLAVLEGEAPPWLRFGRQVLAGKNHNQFAGLNAGLTALFTDVAFPAERFLRDGPSAVADHVRKLGTRFDGSVVPEAVAGERAVIDAACNLGRQRRFADAIRVLDYGLELHPASVSIRYYRAQMLEHGGWAQEAVAAYRGVLEASPSPGLAGMTTIFLDNLLAAVKPSSASVPERTP